MLDLTTFHDSLPDTPPQKTVEVTSGCADNLTC